MVTRTSRWVALGAMVVGAMAFAAGCDDLGADGGPVTTVGELSRIVSSAPTRVQIKLAPGGAVHELRAHHEVGHDEHVEGRVAVVDPITRTLEIEDVGVVAWSSGVRFRTAEESRVSESEWLAAVSAARSAGQVVWVRADRSRALPPLGPTERVFEANELRLEDADSRAKLEVVIGGEHVDDGGVTYLGIRHAMRGGSLGDDTDTRGGDDADDDSDGDDDDDDDDRR